MHSRLRMVVLMDHKMIAVLMLILPVQVCKRSNRKPWFIPWRSSQIFGEVLRKIYKVILYFGLAGFYFSGIRRNAWL